MLKKKDKLMFLKHALTVQDISTDFKEYIKKKYILNKTQYNMF